MTFIVSRVDLCVTHIHWPECRSPIAETSPFRSLTPGRFPMECNPSEEIRHQRRHLSRIGVTLHTPFRSQRIRPHAGIRRSVGRFERVRVRQVEFPSTVKANLVRAVSDHEHTTEMTVPTAEKELEHSQQQLHKSCARWRRSQLPLASSHSSRERTLARARAIAQSAAP